MAEPQKNNRLIGILGIVFGIVCLGSFLFGDNTKLILPVSNLFLIKYLIIICIINGGLYFIIAGALGFMGILIPSHAKTKIEYKRTKAKGILFSAVLLIPFWLSFFTTIFVMSKTMLWKIVGSLALIYIAWLIYSSIQVLKKRHKEQPE